MDNFSRNRHGNCDIYTEKSCKILPLLPRTIFVLLLLLF